MFLPIAVLLAALVGPERPVTAPSYGPAYGSQQPHALVSDGTDFLAVWNGYDGTYAAAVDERGNPRPTPPQPLFRAFGVRAVWAGDAYVLLWMDEQQRTLMMRVNRDAQPISTPVVIAGNASPMAVGASGGRLLVLLGRYEGTTAMLVSSNGEVLRSDIALPVPTRPETTSIAGDGTGFVVATAEESWSQSGVRTTVRVTRVSADGAAGGSVKLIEGLRHDLTAVDVESDGSRAGIAFVARRNSVNGPQWLYAFTVDARTLSTTAHTPRLVAGDEAQVVPTPGGFAAGLLEKASESAPLLLTTIPFASDTRHSTPLGSAYGVDLRMATNGGTVLSVWRDFRFSPPQQHSTSHMFGIALDATASAAETDVVPVAISAVAQSRTSIASAGTTSLVAWMDLTKTEFGNVLVRRVDGRGNPLDEPIALATDVAAHQRPLAVFTGEVWIVTWTVQPAVNVEARTLMRRVARDGSVLDAQPVDVGRGHAAAAASNGTVTLLAFDKWLLRFSAAGELLGTIALPEAAWGGAIASNGSEFLLVWDEGSDWWQFPSPNLRDLRAIRLDATGTPLDTTPIDISMSPANELAPAVTSNGTDFLVVYRYVVGDDSGVRAKRVLRTGVLADHTSLDAGSFVGRGETSHAVAPREGGYVAVYARTTGRSEGSIELVMLDATGAANGQPVHLGTTRWGGWLPWTALTGTMVVYSRTEESLGQIERVFVRGIGVEPGRRRPIGVR